MRRPQQMSTHSEEILHHAVDRHEAFHVRGRLMKAIAWETEVWLTDTPNHMIHYDGQKCLGPRK